MGVCEIVKDVLVFLLTVPLVVLLCSVAAVFHVWKFAVSVFVLISYGDKISFLSALDLFFLNVEDSEPNYHLHPRKFTAVTIKLNGQITASEIRRRFEQDVVERRDENGHLVFKRIRERIIKKFGYIFFIEDENFSIHNHIRIVNNKWDASSAHEIIKTENCSPIKEKSSMWELIIIPKYNNENKMLLLFRAHHVFMDGMSILKILSSAADKSSPNLIAKSVHPITVKPLAPVGSIAQHIRNIYRRSIALPRAFMSENAARKNFKNDSTSTNCYLANINKIPLNLFKELKAHNITFNLAIATAISAAISSTQIQKKNFQLDVGHITGVLTFPRANKGSSAVGNSVLLANFNFSTLEMPLEDRIQMCRMELAKAREGVYPTVTGLLSKIGVAFPASLFMKYFLPNVTQVQGIVFSNVPGPSTLLKFCDVDILELGFTNTGFQNPWLTFSVLSYTGIIGITISASAAMFHSEAEFKLVAQNFEESLFTLFDRLQKNEV